MRLQILVVFILILVIFPIIHVSASIHLQPIIVKSPGEDVIYEEGTTGHNLTWAFEAHELNDEPSHYSITVNGEPLAGHTLQTWMDNVDIVVIIDGLAIGNYVYEITVNDTGVDLGQVALGPLVDSVTVHVTEDTDAPISSTTSSTSTTPEGNTSESTTATLESTTPSDAALPFLAMVLAIAIGIPILKIKDFRK